MKNVLSISLFFLAFVIVSCTHDETEKIQNQRGIIVPGKNEGTADRFITVLLENGKIAKIASVGNILNQAKVGETFRFSFREMNTMNGVTEIDLLNAAKVNDAAFPLAEISDLGNWVYEGAYQGDFNGESYDSTGVPSAFSGVAFLELGIYQGKEYRYDYDVHRSGGIDYFGSGTVDTLPHIGFYDKLGFRHSPNPPTSDFIIISGDYSAMLYGNDDFGWFLYLHKTLDNNGYITYNLQRL